MADGDRSDHDLAPAGRDDDQAGISDVPVPGRRRRGLGRSVADRLGRVIRLDLPLDPAAVLDNVERLRSRPGVTVDVRLTAEDLAGLTLAVALLDAWAKVVVEARAPRCTIVSQMVLAVSARAIGKVAGPKSGDACKNVRFRSTTT